MTIYEVWTIKAIQNYENASINLYRWNYKLESMTKYINLYVTYKENSILPQISSYSHEIFRQNDYILKVVNLV